MSLLATLKELKVQCVSVIALNGITYDPSTPYGRVIAPVLADTVERKCEPIQERIAGFGENGITSATAAICFRASSILSQMRRLTTR